MASDTTPPAAPIEPPPPAGLPVAAPPPQLAAAAAAGAEAAVEQHAEEVTGAALYVADLAVDVAEAQLGELFSQVAPVLSAHVCRAVDGYTSLGYGYVNFGSREDASRALEALNFAPLNGKCIRVMFSNRDPTIRHNGRANVFIKNLERNIDNKGLYEMFCSFGAILSCKVATDFSGQSKGHGFVQFENEESAKKSIDCLNGMLANGKKIFVGIFMRREERERIVGPTKFTNVYIKNLPEEFTDDDLCHEFATFGEITSAVVMKDAAGKSRCFGFVNFKNPESAATAIENRNGTSIKDMVLYVGKAQKRAERLAELRGKFEHEKNGKPERHQGLNLYVKNLDDSISDVHHLRKLFEGFGEIGSCKVMLDAHGRSKGFGFVSFNSVEAAQNAICGMNGKIVGRKPLYVAIAQRKEERKAFLKAHFAAIRSAGARAPPTIVPRPFYFGQAAPQAAAGFGYQPHFVPAGTRPGGVHDMVMPPFSTQRPRHGVVAREHMFHLNNSQYMPSVNHPPMQHPSFPSPMLPPQLDVYNVAHRDAALGAPIPAPAAQISSSSSSVPAATPAPASIPSSSSNLPTALASADPEGQRSILVNNLYPLVHQHEPEHADKVTGILLEMDKDEVLNLIETAGDLHDKVREAMDALRQRQDAPPPPSTD